MAIDRDASRDASADGEPIAVRAAMLVDASGRDGFMASRYGERRRIPNLGKVALFAHYRGARRGSGLEEGNIRIYAFKDGWCWWIPLADNVTSVGAVCHARTVRAFAGPVEDLLDSMIARSRACRRLAGPSGDSGALDANSAYHNCPSSASRSSPVGDASPGDPIF